MKIILKYTSVRVGFFEKYNFWMKIHSKTTFDGKSTGQLSSVNCPVSAVVWQLSCVSCRVTAVVCQLSSVSCRVSAVVCQLSCDSCRVSAVVWQLSCVSCDTRKLQIPPFRRDFCRGAKKLQYLNRFSTPFPPFRQFVIRTQWHYVIILHNSMCFYTLCVQ